MTVAIDQAANSYIVRHGTMRMLGEFAAENGAAYSRGTRVVVRTERGLELGDLLCVATKQAVAYLPEPTKGEILRSMTTDDIQREEKIRADSKLQFETAGRLVAEHHLAMQLVDVEPIFGGERLVFYFLSEKRVDFRELVRAMAREFQARIELRQIGVRDEAKLLADYGDCGKPVCCNTHMTVMPPVSLPIPDSGTNSKTYRPRTGRVSTRPERPEQRSCLDRAPSATTTILC